MEDKESNYKVTPGKKMTKFFYTQKQQLSIVTEESFDELDVDIFKPIEDADRLER
jgi:hypothetical protein